MSDTASPTRWNRLTRSVRGLADVRMEMAELVSRIATTEWCADAAAYERLRRIVADRRTRTLKIVSVLRDPADGTLTHAGREKRSTYYDELVERLRRESPFGYERVVVTRGALGREKRRHEEFATDLLGARPDFAEHCRQVLDMTAGDPRSACQVDFFVDSGHLLDVAFTVALDSADRPLSLVLEIGTACSGAGGGRSPRPDVGILVIDNPADDLVAAFLAAHRAFRAPSAIGVTRIDPRIINRVVGAAR
jgi:hypothetical protein